MMIYFGGCLYIAEKSNQRIRLISLARYYISPKLPSGLFFDSTTGAISGTPTTFSPSTNYVITAFNSGGMAKSNISIKVSSNSGYKILGKIITPKNKIIKNGSILISGNSIANELTDTNGIYIFNSLDTGNYTIRPSKNNDITKANGINTTDALFVQRHILGSPKLNSAYKIIAGDVNGDKAVNATDVLRIKRLILGTDTTFTKGTGANKIDRLWEFVDSAYIFPDTTNPFPFKDSISFTNLTSNKINQTFIGVKLGDVNYDWNPAVAKGLEAKPVEFVYHVRSAQNVRPNTTNGADFQSDLIKIPITVKNFKELVAMQYTLHFDNKNYEFVNLEGFKNLQGFDYNSTQANSNGNIAMLWTDKNAIERRFEDGAELFTLVLKQKGIGNLELGISDAITEIAAWDKDLNQHNIILTKRATNNEQLETRNEVFSVSPNPTNGAIKVSLVSNTNKTVVFQLTDAQGKTILKQVAELQKGNNSFTMNLKKNGNLTAGIYFLKAVGFEGDNVRRIMVK